MCARGLCFEQRACAVRSGVTSVKMGGEIAAPIRSHSSPSPSPSPSPSSSPCLPYRSFCFLRRGYTVRASARCTAKPCSSSKSRNVGATPGSLGFRCPHAHAEAPPRVPQNTSGRLEGGARPHLGRNLLLECPDWRDLLVIILDAMSVCVCISNVERVLVGLQMWRFSLQFRFECRYLCSAFFFLSVGINAVRNHRQLCA